MRRESRAASAGFMLLCIVAGAMIVNATAHAQPTLRTLGRYDFQSRIDHLLGVSVFDQQFLAVASVNGIAMVARSDIEAGPTSTNRGRYLISPFEQSNLDGATPTIQYRPKFFHVASGLGHVYATTRYDGLWIFRPTRVGNGWRVDEVGRHVRPREFTEGVAVLGQRLFLAHHADGIEVMSLADPAQPITIATLGEPLIDAWSVLPTAIGRLWVADGAGGLKLVRFTGEALEFIAGDTRQTSPGTVFDAALSGPWVIAAAGGQGLAVYQAATAERVSTTAVPGVCVDLQAMAGGLVAAACRDWLHAVRVLPDGTVEIVASQRIDRRPRGRADLSTHLAQAVAVDQDRVYVAGWDQVDALRLLADGQGASARLELSAQRTQFGAAPGSVQIELHNAGGATLQVNEVTCTLPSITCELDGNAIAPGEIGTLTIAYDGVTRDVRGRLDLATNDPFLPVAGILVFADQPALVDPGDVAPLFSGPTVTRDYDSGEFVDSNLSLDEFAARGERVLFGVVSTYCPACPSAFTSMVADVAASLPPGTALFLVDEAEPTDVMRHVLEKIYLPIEIFLDTDGVVGRGLYDQRNVGFPQSRFYLVDASGIATHVFTGYDPGAFNDALNGLLR